MPSVYAGSSWFNTPLTSVMSSARAQEGGPDARVCVQRALVASSGPTGSLRVSKLLGMC